MVATKEKIWQILEQVKDPEIPVLTVIDMGIIREINLSGDQLEVVITPTYSGCPAMNMIEVDIKAVLQENGFQNVKVTSILSPAWTTDWLSEEGRKKLKAYGIAPPVESSKDKNALFQDEKKVQCPQCDSFDTQLVSQFGSTPCKALYKCNNCLEPFDYFKCH
jgi:ring-1,2-phenylacetyl-CoA epoxidase subunit PaaD